MKSKAVIFISIGVFLYLAFSTCVVVLVKDDQTQMDWEDRQAYNLKVISKLKVGDSRDFILEKMGAPDLTEAKKTEDGVMQIMFYRTHHVRQDGFTTQDECTGLIFIDDVLQAWGKHAYDQYTKTL
ncbi:DUF3192 domain-containing protein [Catenovulum sp. SM1970]|uniref:DUF3192 domain-containing protein n=1 Tax=Marinifaba aquimaris TaxID=2741323 RepID=UPI00157346F6|nr:DUF3192 domain-containing protein [Marinifaba aquimaris]NTS77674.1 DUF3192 domain-containing protein [Marinifaba aquimaris]